MEDDKMIAQNEDEFSVGDRVQLHPATDSWMKGDRYGEIVGYVRTSSPLHTVLYYRVKLDKSGAQLKFSPGNLMAI
jgi:hypothetical protein